MNAKKLFDDFSGIDKLRRCRNGFEVSWEWREKIGDGLMSMIKLRPDPLQGIKNGHPAENVTISFESDCLPVAFGFSIS